MSARVIVPASTALPPLPGGAEIVRYTGLDDVLAGLAGCPRAVLVSDGLGADLLASVAAAIRESGATVIEVHSRRWDGDTHSPLTAACRGVIAGFGPGAVRYALEALV